MSLGLPWFGPKVGFGWGWTPVAWQGWLLTALFLVVFLAAYYTPIRSKALICSALLVAYLSVVIATGTKPGGSLF